MRDDIKKAREILERYQLWFGGSGAHPSAPELNTAIRTVLTELSDMEKELSHGQRKYEALARHHNEKCICMEFY